MGFKQARNSWALSSGKAAGEITLSSASLCQDRNFKLFRNLPCVVGSDFIFLHPKKQFKKTME